MGPLMVRAIGSDRIAGWDAISWANAVATVLLAGSAVWMFVTACGAKLITSLSAPLRNKM
jgi:hypothetical protein